MLPTTKNARARLRFFLVLALAAGTLGTPARAHQVSCSDTPALGAEWRMMGNQITGDRVQPVAPALHTGAVRQLAPVWTFDANRASNMANNEITGYPIVADGCVYVGSSLEAFGQIGWVFALNADTGELVWRTRTKGGVYSTLAVVDGLVYAFVSRVGSPYVVALDQRDGSVVWERTVDLQVGSDAVSSPIVYDGMVWVGVSGTAAEIDEGDRRTFQGSFALLDAKTGALLKKTYTIPEEAWEEGYAGGAIWSSISIDPATSYGFAGTGNPFDDDLEYETTNSILKIDVARARAENGAPVPSAAITNPTFGEIVDSYKGNVEQYFPPLDGVVPCEEIEQIQDLFAFGFECVNLDLDFGATPNVFKDSTGRTLVGLGQKSGVYHAVDPDTMEVVWTSLLGVPSAVGGIVGSAAFDGRSLIGPHTLGSYLWSVNKDSGGLNWLQPTGSGINWGPPVTYANRVVYTVELSGFLDAFDSATGVPLLRYPLIASPDSPGALVPVTERPPLSWGGVTVARDTVYVSAGVGLTSASMPSVPTGFVIAFRPSTIRTP